MKKSILITILLTVITLFGYTQKVKDTTITQPYDTIYNSYDVYIRLDSLSYQQLLQFVGSIPPSVNKSSGGVLSLLDNTYGNVTRQNRFALKPKKKK